MNPTRKIALVTGVLMIITFITSIPEFIWELSFGIYLTVKGFKPTPITAGDTRPVGADNDSPARVALAVLAPPRPATLDVATEATPPALDRAGDGRWPPPGPGSRRNAPQIGETR